MAAHVYTTEGLVVRRVPFGEANLLVTLFTRELGLITALAQSSRREDSKLRFALCPLTLGEHSIVAGNSFRIVGASVHTALLTDETRALARPAGSIALLLTRLLPQHEPHPALFKVVREGLLLMCRHATEEGVLKNIECMLVLRILAVLGYLPDIEGLRPYIQGDAVTAELARSLEPLRKDALRAINTSLGATGL